MPKIAEKTDTLTPGAALLRLREQPFDYAAIAALVPGTVATQNEVGRAFGLSPNTIKTSWQSAGMPGTKGDYSLAEIARWRLQHLAELDRKRRSVEDLNEQELKRRTAEAEARKIEADADRKERENAVAIGSLVDREAIIAAWKKNASTLAERLAGVPDQIAPMLPADTASMLTEDIRGMIARALTAYSETTPRDLGIDDK